MSLSLVAWRQFILLAALLSLSIVLLQGATTIQAARRYKQDEHVPLLAAKAWPHDNPSETYAFSRFGYCQPTKDAARSQDLGKDISGVRMIDLQGYKLGFRTDVDSAEVCEAFRLSKKQVKNFRDAVNRSFVILVYFGTVSRLYIIIILLSLL